MSLSRCPLFVVSVFAGASTQPCAPLNVGAPNNFPEIVLVVPVKSPTVALASNDSRPCTEEASGTA